MSERAIGWYLCVGKYSGNQTVLWWDKANERWLDLTSTGVRNLEAILFDPLCSLGKIEAPVVIEGPGNLPVDHNDGCTAYVVEHVSIVDGKPKTSKTLTWVTEFTNNLPAGQRAIRINVPTFPPRESVATELKRTVVMFRDKNGVVGSTTFDGYVPRPDLQSHLPTCEVLSFKWVHLTTEGEGK